MKASHSDTIAAPATPPGRGAVSLIRVSGPEARSIVRTLTPVTRPWQPRTAHLCPILATGGELLDRVLVTWFPAPASYTGEELCEISCHGSPAVVEAILSELLAAGARLARPGEFTQRAFLNHKLDLLQAEAVRDLIESTTRFQARVASEQMEGRLSRQLEPVRTELIRISSHLETSLEFVEDEISPDTRQQLGHALQGVIEGLRRLSGSFRLGRLVREGYRVAVAGRPNVGKSSIFNSLLGDERTIVTALPGTTRDAVAEMCEISGMLVRLVDTAGIRSSSDLLENLGVERSRREIEGCDLVLLVLDGSEPLRAEDLQIWEQIRERPLLLVRNKIDLPQRLEIPGEMGAGGNTIVKTSALLGEGMGELRSALSARMLRGLEGFLVEDSGMLTNLRQKRCVDELVSCLEKALVSLREGLSEEFVVFDMRRGLQSLGELTGEITVDDLLEKIFSSFCIGK